MTVRDRRRLRALEGRDVEVVDADVLDRRSMRRALAGCDMLFHTAGVVASRPYDRVWRVNAVAPRIAVEEAAARGVRPGGRSPRAWPSIGPAPDGRAATERNPVPGRRDRPAVHRLQARGGGGGLGAAERVGHGPACRYVPRTSSGRPYNRALPGETSTRIVGQLPARPAARDRGRLHEHRRRRGRCAGAPAGGAERAGRVSATSSAARTCAGPEVIERIAKIAGVRHPLIVLPPESAESPTPQARARADSGSLEGIRLMAPDWRYSSARARRELGYRPRRASETLKRTVDWCQELIEDDRLPASKQPLLRRR